MPKGGYLGRNSAKGWCFPKVGLSFLSQKETLTPLKGVIPGATGGRNPTQIPPRPNNWISKSEELRKKLKTFVEGRFIMIANKNQIRSRASN